ncbi:transposase, partial [Clostridium neuense]
KAGVEVETVIGDAAYSEKDNIVYAKGNDIKLVARLSESVTHGNRKNSNKFEFNKDAGMYVCQEGHMAFKKTIQKKNNTKKNQTEQYFFDVNKCKCCPSREGCYKEGNKTKTYSVTILSNPHKEQIKFQESEYFQEKSKERYKIEAKNSELKYRHGY